MTVVRQAAVAGRFYPDDARQLRAAVREYAAAAATETTPPKAIIVPHAGYVYSGPVAGSGYAQLQPLRGTIEHVVLLGPTHFVPFRGLGASSAGVFETPLGPVNVDTQSVAAALKLPQVQVLDEAHAYEHSLEVHFPFLQETLGEFKVVPLVVGETTHEEVAEVIELLWGGPETLIVISSDLSHYHDYETACRLDGETSKTIEESRIGDLRGDRACGFLPIGGLLRVAEERGFKAHTIDLRNSGDTAGPYERVVGYGAYVLTADETASVKSAGSRASVVAQETLPDDSPGEAEEISSADSSAVDDEQLAREHGQMLFMVAKAAIQRGLSYGMKPEINLDDYAPLLQLSRATFVTLTISGELRGCMGSLRAIRPLVVDVAHNTYSSAFLDPRFSPLRLYETDRLSIQISILSPPQPVSFDSEADLLEQLRPGIDGLIIYEGRRRGTLLPAVWKKIPDRRNFLSTVKQKAGLAPDYWSPTVRVDRYMTTSIMRTS